MRKILVKYTKVSKHKNSGVVKIQTKDLTPYIGKTVRAIIQEQEASK